MTKLRPVTRRPIAEAPDELGMAVRSLPSLLESLRKSFSDLEERARAVERELCVSNAKLEAVLESIPSGVIVRDAQGRIVRVNRAASRILGLPHDELIGGFEHALLSGDAADGSVRELVRPDGSRLALAARHATVHLADGRRDGSVEVLDDCTDTIVLGERLHASDKMAALGTLAAGIAHELRNPLSAVKGFATLLSSTDSLDERARRWASLIEQGAEQVDAIIEGMLSFGSPERLRLEAIEADTLVWDAVGMAFPHDLDRSRWTVIVETRAPRFLGDRLKLRHALRNLVANAIDAQEHGGTIKVELFLSEKEIIARVSDAGSGIPPAIRHRICDPFFTTRSAGTGLGLALVSTVAKLHGGGVDASAEPSVLGGAELVLRIPFSAPQAPSPTPPHTSLS